MNWNGMDEFREALRNLPADLAAEAGDVIEATAMRVVQRVQAVYPEGPTGNLRRRVRIEKGAIKGRFGAAFRVRSAAPHASIYEFGTKQRMTSKGANRGRMPVADPGRRLIPIAVSERAVMIETLKALVRKAGFQVE